MNGYDDESRGGEYLSEYLNNNVYFSVGNDMDNGSRWYYNL